MEHNPQLDLANDFLEYTGVNVFLTGKAGTGKTTFLRRLRECSPKRMIVVAPTGVAAINAGGVTIHSFFQLPFGPHVPGMGYQNSADGKSRLPHKFVKEKLDIIRTMDLLVIDEISMVRADLLDAVDEVLRHYRDREKPFGGVQLLMIGDLHQLAPVVKDDEWILLRQYYESVYFFHSKALAATSYVSIELKRVYRQQDERFVEILNRVREGCLDISLLETLNRRYIPDFHPKEEEGYITLTTHNSQAQRINELKMAQLPSKAYSYKAEVERDFPVYAYPTDETLVLKKGAQVMFVKNDSSLEKEYYNGKIGTVVAIDNHRIEVEGKEDGKVIFVEPEEWVNSKYMIDEDTGAIQETVVGIFRQYPLKTAWAITIHKSQGLTFDRVIVDANAAFAHGQVYVALSRCKTFEGLVLSSRLNERSLVRDRYVEDFVAGIEADEPGQETLQAAAQQYFRDLLLEQFDYGLLGQRLDYLYRVLRENLFHLYSDWVERYRMANVRFDAELANVAGRFRQQLCRLTGEGKEPESDPYLAERIVKGAVYFSERTADIFSALLAESLPCIDNEKVRMQVEQAWGRLKEEVYVKMVTLQAIRQGFNVRKYLQVKAKAYIDASRVKSSARQSAAEQVEVLVDILHPQLYEKLCVWRSRESERLQLPAYTILQQKALLGIANTLPTSSKELLAIPGIGKKIIERYGTALLEIVDAYRFPRWMEG